MNISISFIRAFFLLLCALFATTYAITIAGSSFGSITIGALGGIIFGTLLIAIESFFKEVNLRTLNTLTLGLFCGFLLGEVIMLTLNSFLNALGENVNHDLYAIIQGVIFIISIYLGITLAMRASNELYACIPFVRFKATNQKKKDLLCDISSLSDSRIIDLAASGLLDNQLIIPRFILKEIHQMNENSDEVIKSKARRCLETIKKLESMPSLNLKYSDTDFPEIKDIQAKYLRLAKILDVSIITADLNRIQQSTSEGIRTINIQGLSVALKPITQNGELLTIKIQRYGKEPRQGVGYLDDGTMVVVNGGAEYIGETIKAQVLSVKHTTSGRMIFCNTTEEHLANMQQDMSLHSPSELENGNKSYYP